MADAQIAIIDGDQTQVVLAPGENPAIVSSIPGPQGPAGAGVPLGGTTNQVLFKQSGTNYDTAWGAITSAMIGDLEIVNADVSASAAIAGTKISPNFGSQNVVTTGTSTAASFIPSSSTVPTNGLYLSAANSVALSTNGTGRLFIDASGRILAGTSTARANYYNSTGSAQIQVEGTAFSDSSISITSNNNAGSYVINRSNGTSVGSNTLVANNNTVGGIVWQGNDGAEFVQCAGITAAIDGTPGADDMPGRLVFSTTADGAASPTERLRIDNQGRLRVGTDTGRAVEAFGNTTFGTVPHIFEGSGSVDTVSILLCNNSSTTAGHGPGLALARSRGSTNNSNTIVQSGDNLGTISFSGADGTDIRSKAATISAEVDGTPGANDMPGRLVFSTTPDGAASPTERLRIDSSGRVGIGTTSPGDYNADGDDLVIAGTGNRGITISSTNSATSRIYFADGTVGADTVVGSIRYDHTNNSLYFSTNTSDRVIIDSSGTFRVKGAGTAGVTDAVQLNGSAPANSLLLDASGRVLVGTSSARSNFDGNTATPLFQIEGVTAATASASVVRGANDTTGSTFNLGKTRATAVGGNTVVSSGDQIGIINFQAADGTNLIDAASIQAVVDGTPGANDMPGRLVFSTTADGASSPTERARIDSFGAFKASTNGTYPILGVGTTAAHEFSQSNNNTAAFHVTHTGNGTTYGYYYRSTNSDPNNTTSYVFQAVQNTNVNIYTIWSNGTVSARSDARYKKNIETTRDGYLEDISLLRVVKYNWYNHEDGTPQELGFIAQEVEQVFPGLVLSEPDKDENGISTGEVSKSIKTSVFTPILVKALQEAVERIKNLEAKVAALEAQ